MLSSRLVTGSRSRAEVIRPTLGRHRTPYFYNTPYEGGVWDDTA